MVHNATAPPIAVAVGSCSPHLVLSPYTPTTSQTPVMLISPDPLSAPLCSLLPVLSSAACI
ncbi:hypothetical protein PLICRDRAFT_281989 [Plicaturopsis crispa FD-325 SS-3]|nr:hypothetical protein PLICRDRAFT_281989 [Plicaturopsis crispa FD-325 SS-3]